jgi:uncharacterized protein (TIGR03067 family)
LCEGSAFDGANPGGPFWGKIFAIAPAGVNLNHQRRSRGPGGGPSGKDRLDVCTHTNLVPLSCATRRVGGAGTRLRRLSLLAGADAPKTDAAKDEEALQGTWKLDAGEADGKALPEKQLKEGKLVIKGDQYTVTLADKGTVTGTQKLDPTKKPKTIDIVDAGGPNKDKTCLGIYELKGDEFHVCFAPPGKPRPTKFATGPDSGQWMHVWKRVKE